MRFPVFFAGNLYLKVLLTKKVKTECVIDTEAKQLAEEIMLLHEKKGIN